MMKQLITILSLLPFLAFSQNNVSPWTIDLLYSPDSYAPPQIEADASFYQESAYHIGFNIIKNIEDIPRMSFRTGMRYNIYNQRVKSFGINSQFPNALSYQSYVNIRYFDMPFALRYTLGKKKLHAYGEIIGTVNINRRDNQTNLNSTWGLSLGLEYLFTPHFGFFTQPTFRKPMIQNKDYFFMLGIETGLKFRFAKG